MSNGTENSSTPFPVPPESTPPAEGRPAAESPWLYSAAELAGKFAFPPVGAAGGPVAPIPAPQAPAAPTVQPQGPAAGQGASVLGGAPRPLQAVPPAKPPQDAAASRQSKPPEKFGDQNLASVIDTIEAIIIALIIALTFRAFIVEAFVIPTGSMAPTLLGAHFKVTCPACGFAYDRDANLHYQLRESGSRHWIDYVERNAELVSNTSVPVDDVMFCPNCHFPITPEQLPQYLRSVQAEDRRKGPQPRSVPLAWANNGDRILVLKYLYPFMEPSRWDVIVFKEPMAARDNYIKRLIGLPGETLEIIQGDIYVNKPGEKDEATRMIARKPDYVQDHVWQLVYDNDYYPADEGKPRAKYNLEQPEGTTWTWDNPWAPAAATAKQWNAVTQEKKDASPGGPVMAYTGTTPSTLQFMMRDPYAKNVLGYNNDNFVVDDQLPRHSVGDLRLEAHWSPKGNSGPVMMTIGRPGNRFRVRWGTDGLSLGQFDKKTGTYERVKPNVVDHPPVPEDGKAYTIAMNNVDHAVRFYVNGKCVLWHEAAWSAGDAKQAEEQERKERRPDALEALDAEVRIDVEGPCTLAHLKLFRDLYYTQTESNISPDPRQGYAQTANEGYPLTLSADEFFPLGDNSRRSLDGRMWNEVYPALDDLGTPRGIVPRRYLLGRAFFVYWPAGYRASDQLPILKNLPLVPNFGDMRFIH